MKISIKTKNITRNYVLASRASGPAILRSAWHAASLSVTLYKEVIAGKILLDARCVDLSRLRTES